MPRAHSGVRTIGRRRAQADGRYYRTRRAFLSVRRSQVPYTTIGRRSYLRQRADKRIGAAKKFSAEIGEANFLAGATRNFCRGRRRDTRDAHSCHSLSVSFRQKRSPIKYPWKSTNIALDLVGGVKLCQTIDRWRGNKL